jgi:hypothetical protein
VVVSGSVPRVVWPHCWLVTVNLKLPSLLVGFPAALVVGGDVAAHSSRPEPTLFTRRRGQIRTRTKYWFDPQSSSHHYRWLPCRQCRSRISDLNQGRTLRKAG